MSTQPAGRVRNRLLSRLEPQDLERLLPHLKPIAMVTSQPIYEVRAPIEYVYFPEDCVTSAVTALGDGNAIEVGTIGNEGMTGSIRFLGRTDSPNRVFVQVAGKALRMEGSVLEEMAIESRSLRDLLLRHHRAFLAQISQSVACNGLHPLLKRCCRWLLMTHDRTSGDELPLTHEFLSYMLGVRRSGVTEALQALQSQALIENGRATIKIIDRTGMENSACECYRIVREEYERLLGSE